jgi:hypothetical protein
VLWGKHASVYASSVIIDSTFQDELVEILSGVEPKFESSVRENRIFLILL